MKLTPDQIPFLDLSAHRRAEEYQPGDSWPEVIIGGCVLAVMIVICAVLTLGL